VTALLVTGLAAACAAVAAALALPVRPTLRDPTPVRGPAPEAGWLHRYRLLWCGLGGLGALLFLQGPAAPVAGLAAAVGTWVVVGRTEPADVRRRRAEVRRDLPHVVDLFAATLRSGAAPADGVAIVAGALPGAAADRLATVAARLAIGLDPIQVWEGLAGDPELGRLGRALARAQATGAPVVATVERLADDLAHTARADTEERARSVGVKAALPLGLCLLPAFVLIGIVPLVVALLSALDLG